MRLVGSLLFVLLALLALPAGAQARFGSCTGKPGSPQCFVWTGKVVATEGEGVRATATIDFGASGTIRLMLIGSVPMVKL